MEGNFCLNQNQLIVNTANEFFEFFERFEGDVISPYVIKNNYKQEGILKHFDRGLVPHSKHKEYFSDIQNMQED